MKTFYTAIGLMSGTSMDGIDVSLIKSDGEIIYEVMGNHFYPYNDDDRALLSNTMSLAPHPPSELWVEQMTLCSELVTSRHITAIDSFLASTLYQHSEIDFIGFHGQTVLHQPQNARTIQLGDGKKLAQSTGIDVVYDFRTNDVMHGGQGAPLVPIFHQALVNTAKMRENCVIVNIGGVANLSFIAPQSGQLIAFDIGPGNALMDDWIKQHTGQAMDENGQIARQGQVHQDCLQDYLSHAFFTKTGTKSLDRNDFPLSKITRYHLSVEDGAATLCEFTAQTIANAAQLLPQKAQNWVITGGGTKNTFLMQRLTALIDAKVSKAEDFDWNSDFMESQAFGFLAVRHHLGLPQTFPDTTGISQPLTGGVLAKADL